LDKSQKNTEDKKIDLPKIPQNNVPFSKDLTDIWLEAKSLNQKNTATKDQQHSMQKGVIKKSVLNINYF